MESTRLTSDWNAEPNDPEVELTISNDTITLVFFVNYFLYEKFTENDKALITFNNCHKYSFNTMNDEGYYKGQYRYKVSDLPWGEFYKLKSNWEIDFPKQYTLLNSLVDFNKFNHYIFFFRDNIFECVAEGYSLEFHKGLHKINLLKRNT